MSNISGESSIQENSRRAIESKLKAMKISKMKQVDKINHSGTTKTLQTQSIKHLR